VLLAIGVGVASGTEGAVATVGREWLWAAGQRSGKMSASGAARDCVDDVEIGKDAVVEQFTLCERTCSTQTSSTCRGSMTGRGIVFGGTMRWVGAAGWGGGGGGGVGGRCRHWWWRRSRNYVAFGRDFCRRTRSRRGRSPWMGMW